MSPIQKNLVSLSVNMECDDYETLSVADAFPEEVSLESVRNLRICSNCTSNFQDQHFIAKICDRFPKLSFLYLAFRYSRLIAGWFAAEECLSKYLMSDIEFPENNKSSLKTLAFDECFYTEKTIERLGEFHRLEKVIVGVLDANDYFTENYVSMHNVTFQSPRDMVRYVKVKPDVRRALKRLKKKVVSKLSIGNDDGEYERKEEIYEEVPSVDCERRPAIRVKPFDLDCVSAHRHLNADVKAAEVKLSTIWTSLNDD